jgi:phosphate transport system substrate-binding protein
MSTLRLFAVVLAAAALTLPLAACKKGGEESTAETVAAEKISGTIEIKGSDTLLALSQDWADQFQTGNPDAIIQVTGGGSGTGIEALLAGEVDIANASRAAKDKEKAAAVESGISLVEVPVAVDGICFVINPSNELSEVSMEQLGAIFAGETKYWDAVGGQGDINCYGRQPTSGTYDFVKKNVLAGAEYGSAVKEMQSNTLLCDNVARDPNGIAYVGYGYASKRNDVKVLAVKKTPTSAAITPSPDTIGTMDYPVSRYLFNYTNGKPAGLAQAFIKYALSPEGQKLVEDAEYTPLPENKLKESLAKIE